MSLAPRPGNVFAGGARGQETRKLGYVPRTGKFVRTGIAISWSVAQFWASGGSGTSALENVLAAESLTIVWVVWWLEGAMGSRPSMPSSHRARSLVLEVDGGIGPPSLRHKQETCVKAS